MILVEKVGLVAGSLIQRYKRFLADVQLEDGSVVTAHTTNTGSMKTCWDPGDRVLLEPATNPDRKLKFTWLAVERSGGWVGVETGMPNRVVAEAARRDLLPGMSGLHGVRTEVKYGAENSRIDVLALDGEGRQVFIEVKNTTLKAGDWALFPDAVDLTRSVYSGRTNFFATDLSHFFPEVGVRMLNETVLPAANSR